VRRPWTIPGNLRNIRKLVERVRPDIIHSYFVGTTMVLRAALGPGHPIPRIFHVPGPLHLEHRLFGKAEIALAGPRDFWIGASRKIVQLYRWYGVQSGRVFLSYLAAPPPKYTRRRGHLRARCGIPSDAVVFGNCSYMYPPKYYLGHTKGLKRHEDLIDALALAGRRNGKIVGMLIGGPWGGADWYERRLRRRARDRAGDRICMCGFLQPEEFEGAWLEFDCVVHVPISENCGGVCEPLQHGVPVIASRVGAIPEVVLDGKTGYLVPPKSPVALADAIQRVADDLHTARQMAARGQQLALHMFDVRRTAPELLAIYRHILDGAPAPEPFDSRRFLAAMEAAPTVET